jgi:peptide/nickel transport system ATP-binding protein
MAEPILDVTGLTVILGKPPRIVLDEVSLTIEPSSIHALIGGSGSGKTTLAKAVTGLVSVRSGSIRLEGAPVEEARARSGKSIQMVFQDPFSSLDPRYRVRESIEEAVRCDDGIAPGDRPDRVVELAAMVTLRENLLGRYPGQLSGGECQRVAIARAIAARPALLVADEVTSSLDVTVQAKIIGLLDRLASELQIAILLITHNLAIADRLADDLTVLERGRVVEQGIAALTAPHHPYTRLLVDSLLTLDESNPAG